MMAAGLMTQQTGPPRGQERMAPQAGGGAAAPDQESNVAPEEQQAYEQFVNNGYSMIYDKQIMPQVLQSLSLAREDPVEALANTSAMVVMALEDSAESKEQPVDNDVKMHGGIEILEDLAGLAGEAGIHDYSEEEIEGAVYRALDIYREARQEQGRVDQDHYQQQFQELVQLDQAGQLDQMAPGLKEHFSGGQGQGQEQASRGGGGGGLMQQGRRR